MYKCCLFRLVVQRSFARRQQLMLMNCPTPCCRHPTSRPQRRDPQRTSCRTIEPHHTTNINLSFGTYYPSAESPNSRFRCCRALRRLGTLLATLVRYYSNCFYFLKRKYSMSHVFLVSSTNCVHFVVFMLPAGFIMLADCVVNKLLSLLS